MDTEQYKITCRGYPLEFILDKNLAKEYFKQFGKLKRVTFKPKLRICTVVYADEEGYLQAMNNVGEYKGTSFSVSGSVKEIFTSEEKPYTNKESVWLDRDQVETELESISAFAPKDFTSGDGLMPMRDSLKFERVPKLKRTWKSESLSKQRKNLKSNANTKISAEEIDFVNLVLSQALSTEDKYKILDARDKLMKIKLKKNVVVKSGATIGTCPDMCPEKERLFREIKHQVAWYEQEENAKNMNHTKAVKQYSRSSADQEAPLAHELRPAHVLQMTMGYLLHNIIDLSDTDEVHIGEWFYFLWDRTRGIRKDITQQELCSQVAVELVEQCARFHIHCSARLVAEDPSVFDQKINTENLTKCLQTLKYMYNDLLLKGERCENEAEFRAYIILLNLNDGNFMWEVQQLGSGIQRSKEVKFALQVHSAIDKNNYVQFFKLVHSTTYLNSCILMRYFVQVRITAIKTLLKCYIPRAAKTVYPLIELQSMLAFDDIDLTVDFCQYHGLSLNADSTHVILDKNNFATPEFPYMLDRSSVVEDKRKFSVGRIICGRDLPQKTYLNHKIQNSFDSKGFLINRDILDELDLEKVKNKLLEELDKSKDEVISEIKDEENGNIFNQKGISDQFNLTKREEKIANPFALTRKQSGSIFATKVLTPPSTNIFGNPQFAFKSPDSVSLPMQDEPDFVSRNTDIFSKPIVSDSPKKGGFSFNLFQPMVTSSSYIPGVIIDSKHEDLETQRKLDEEIQRKLEFEKVAAIEVERIKVMEQEKIKVMEQEKMRVIEQEKLELEKQQEQKRLCELKLEEDRKKEELKKLKKKKQEQELQRRLEELYKENDQKKEKEIKDTVSKVINSLIIQVDKKIRDEKLVQIREVMKRRLLLKMVQKWRFNISKNKRKRKAMDCSPIWINTKSLEQSAKDLYSPSQDLTLTLMKRYKYGKPIDIGQLVDKQLETIDIHHLTYNILKNNIFKLSVNKPNSIFWKIVVSLPDKTELTNGLNRIEETVNSAFPLKKCNDRYLHLQHIKINKAESVTYCIEKQQGYNVTHYDSNGIIFIAKNFNSNLQRRIFENLKGFGVYTKVPIVIILQEYNKHECKIEELMKQNIVSDYVILVENASALKLFSVIEEGLVFLAKKIETFPPLELDTLKSFMKKYLCSEIWKRANSFAKWNLNYKNCLKNPNIVLNLYNEGLTKLKSIVLNESNKEYAVFPEEFENYLNSQIPDFLPCSYRYFPKFWKNKNYLNNLELVLKKLELPAWQDVWPPPNEYELERSMYKYCTKITDHSEKLFYKVMSLLLQKVDPIVNFKDVQNVLWTDVIELLSLEKLSGDFITLNSQFKSETVFKEYFVVYNINTLNDYRFCDWFYIYNPSIKDCVENELEKYQQKEKKSDKNVMETWKLSDNFEEEIREKYLLNKPDKSNIIKELDELKKTLHDLTECMAIHKKISSKLDESLNKAIAEK